MQKATRQKMVVFFVGLLTVSFLTMAGSLAFFSAEDLGVVLRNVVITDVIFMTLYMFWIKLHKGYEKTYKSAFELEE